jgi:hypothetical protein
MESTLTAGIFSGSVISTRESLEEISSGGFIFDSPEVSAPGLASLGETSNAETTNPDE